MNFENLIYANHAATTGVYPSVIAAMEPYQGVLYGNPSSIDRFSKEARKAVTKSRQQIAEQFETEAENIIFTSGGTESNNLAILGYARANTHRGKHIISSPTEHKSVLAALTVLEKEGFEITCLPVDMFGLINPDEFEQAIRKDTILASIMAVNNETGALQDIEQISEIAHRHHIKLHIDAVQAIPGTLNRIALCADMMSISGHKRGGPKGVGCLLTKCKGEMFPQLVGGGQEFGLRSGTENVSGIVGLHEALRINDSQKDCQYVAGLAEKLLHNLMVVPDTYVNSISPGELSSPYIVNISFGNIVGENLCLALSQQNIVVSAGSACDAHSLHPSHVLQAMQVPKEYLYGAIRISLNESNTRREVDTMLDVIPRTVAFLREEERGMLE